MFIEDPDAGPILQWPSCDDDAGVRSDVRPIALWDAWLFAEAEARLSLRAWLEAPATDKASAHAAYSAALDREEQAARILAQRLCEDVNIRP